MNTKYRGQTVTGPTMVTPEKVFFWGKAVFVRQTCSGAREVVGMSENDPPRGPWVRGGNNTRPLWCNCIHRHTMTVAKWTGFPIGKSTCCMTKTGKREKCKMSCGFIRPGPGIGSVRRLCLVKLQTKSMSFFFFFFCYTRRLCSLSTLEVLSFPTDVCGRMRKQTCYFLTSLPKWHMMCVHCSF